MPCPLITRGSVAAPATGAVTVRPRARAASRAAPDHAAPSSTPTGGAMSALDAGARSADVSWRDALELHRGRRAGSFRLRKCRTSARCSSSLSGSTSQAGEGTNRPQNCLAAQLTTLGYVVHGVDRLGTVEATDTVVMIDGPEPP